MDFKISISETGSQCKTDVCFNRINFELKSISIDEFIGYIKNGHTFCYVFNTSDRFTIREKKLDNFKYTNVIGIDIDDSSVPMNDYVSKLKYKPTVCYTTYSNGIKGYRFRLVFIFNDRISDNYKTVYNSILGANGIELKDNCMASPSQCFIGNGSEDVEIIKNNRVYNVSEFSDFYGNIKSIDPKLINKIIRKKNNTILNLMMNLGSTVNDYISMSYEDYYNKYKDTYQHYSSSQLEYNEDGYSLIDDNYISIYRRYYWMTDENGKRICIKRKWKDGEKRGRKLFCSALLRRKINNNVTFDELLFNTAEELETYYFNDDDRFSKQDVINIVDRVMNLPIEEVNAAEHIKDKRRFALDPSKYEGRSEKSAARQRINKKLNYEEISKYYDPGLKDKENIEILKRNGVKVSLPTLTRYKKEMGIKKPTKNEQIGNLYDPSLSDKENAEVMSKFFNVTSDDIRKWRFNNNIKKERPELINKIIKKKNNTILNLMMNSGRNTHNDKKTTYDRVDGFYSEINDTINRELKEGNHYLEGVSMFVLFNPLIEYLMGKDIEREEKIYALDRFIDYSRYFYEKNNDFGSNLEILYDSSIRLLNMEYNRPLEWIERPYNASFASGNINYHTA